MTTRGAPRSQFRRRRSDTTVASIERDYAIDLNARDDMLLGSLLRDRGFESLSQLLKAYRGRMLEPAAARRVFLSFHAEDMAQVNGLRLMLANPNLNLDHVRESMRTPINSDRGAYLRKVIRAKIEDSEVLVCLIGNGTAWRDWVDWEIETANTLRKGICGVRLKNSRGRVPPALHRTCAKVTSWGRVELIAAIEQAAARRS